MSQPPPPPPPVDPPLPPGWTRHVDDLGRPYYHNSATNTTTWNPPSTSPPPPPPPSSAPFSQPFVPQNPTGGFQHATPGSAPFPSQPSQPGSFQHSAISQKLPPTTAGYPQVPSPKQMSPPPTQMTPPPTQISPPAVPNAPPSVSGDFHPEAFAAQHSFNNAAHQPSQQQQHSFSQGAPGYMNMPPGQMPPPGFPQNTSAPYGTHQHPPPAGGGFNNASPPPPQQMGSYGGYGHQGQPGAQQFASHLSYSGPPGSVNVGYSQPPPHYMSQGQQQLPPGQQPYMQQGPGAPPNFGMQPGMTSQTSQYGMPPQPGQQPSLMQQSSLASLKQGLSTLSIGPGGGGVVYISLEMKATGLRDRDFVGQSDSICYVEVPDQGSGLVSQNHAIGKWKQVGKTEMLENSLNPAWATRVRLPFYFERHQPVRFSLVDIDNKRNMTGQDLGCCQSTLAEIVRNGHMTLEIKSGKRSGGRLTVRAHDENQAGQVRVRLSLEGRALAKKDFMGKSDPFYKLNHVLQNGTSTLYKSKEIRKTLDPIWEPHTVLVPTGGLPWEQVQLEIVVYDWNRNAAPDLIGEAKMTLRELTSSQSFQLTNPTQRAKKGKKGSGELVVRRAEAVELPSFISYIQGGLKLNFIVAVDFTASNRPVDNPASLHYIRDPQRPSMYAQALYAAGTILSGYISDGFMTALGFGAILPNQGNTPSFDFALTGQADPRVQGVSGLLAAYEQAVNNVKLAGPTNFTPLIRNAMAHASAVPVSQMNQHFSVLLILTDGIITDLNSTIDAIIECSYNTPMAIVIVGIGEADFSAMKRLDGDDVILRNDSGREAKHDIVQFTKFARDMPTEALAAHVLQEVPLRVVEYMVDAGIRPNTPHY